MGQLGKGKKQQKTQIANVSANEAVKEERQGQRPVGARSVGRGAKTRESVGGKGRESMGDKERENTGSRDKQRNQRKGGKHRKKGKGESIGSHGKQRRRKAEPTSLATTGCKSKGKAQETYAP